MSKTPSYLAIKVSFRVAREYKNVYLICIFFWSLLGVEKSLGHAQIGLLYGFNSKFPTSIPTPFICGVSPPPASKVKKSFNNLNGVFIGSCRYVYSSKSFLFSLYNINGYAPVKLNIKSSHYNNAIYRCFDRGPAFGNGHDLRLTHEAEGYRNSFTYCGSSFPLPPGYSASGYSCKFYAGSYKFTPSNVEVFYETTT